MPDDLPPPSVQIPSLVTPVAPVTPPAPDGSKKIKIGLAILILFLISISLPMAVLLVRQNQEIRKQAAGECGDRSLGECWGECRGTDEGEVCCTGPSQWSGWRLTRSNSPSCGGGEPPPSQPPPSGDQCTPPDGKIGNDGGGGCCGSYTSKEGKSCDSGGCRDWEDCRISNGACASGTSCGAKECKSNGQSCSGNWECCSGGCIAGTCQGGAPPSQPRSASQVCQGEGGSITSNCTADPNCSANGGVCCNKGTTNHCCYGDSATRRDGACYAGGLQTDITCSGRTMTNNTGGSVSVLRFVGDSNDTTCPFHNPAGTKTLGPKGSLNASCEQLEVPGKCGVCDDTTCGGTPTTPTVTPRPTATPTKIPTATPKPTSTPRPTATATAKPTPTGTPRPTNTPTVTPRLSPTPTNTPRLTPTPTPPDYFAACGVSQVYDTNWNQITNLANIQLNQTVYFATQGSTNHSQGITKARFRINSGTWQETINTHSNLFYIQFIVSSAGSYTVESMVYNPILGWY